MLPSERRAVERQRLLDADGVSDFALDADPLVEVPREGRANSVIPEVRLGLVGRGAEEDAACPETR